MPRITAESWTIFDVTNKKQLYGKKQQVVREMASLTKIMTCYICLNFIKKYNLDIDNIHVIVSYDASLVKGTTANLEYVLLIILK